MAKYKKVHEYSIAASILEHVLKIAEEHGSNRISKITLEIGKLTLLNPEQLKFVFEVISKGTIAEGCKIDIVEIPGEIKCNSCGYNGEVQPIETAHTNIDLLIFTCPMCGSADTEIINGKNCSIKSIELGE